MRTEVDRHWRHEFKATDRMIAGRMAQPVIAIERETVIHNFGAELVKHLLAVANGGRVVVRVVRDTTPQRTELGGEPGMILETLLVEVDRG